MIRGARLRFSVLWILILVLICNASFCFSEGEHYAWDCPECGRQGNTGNYCGSCAHPSPWLEKPAKVIEEGACGDNVTWSLNEDGVLTISGKGPMKNYTEKQTPWQKWSYLIKAVLIEDGVTSIGNNSFSGVHSITSVTIPNTVETIGEYAFLDSDLTDILIPDSVTSIGFAALISCTKLQKIDVSSGNRRFSSNDGILYNKTQTMLIACPGGRRTDVTVPDTVTQIRSYAFDNCVYIKRIALSNNTKWIFNGAFWNCHRLETITIPVGLVTIDESAFSYCNSLKTVFYSGSSAQWGKISIGNDNNFLTEAEIKYNQ